MRRTAAKTTMSEVKAEFEKQCERREGRHVHGRSVAMLRRVDPFSEKVSNQWLTWPSLWKLFDEDVKRDDWNSLFLLPPDLDPRLRCRVQIVTDQEQSFTNL